MADTEEVEQNQSWGLLPLTPEYIEEEHGKYVAEIERALQVPASGTTKRSWWASIRKKFCKRREQHSSTSTSQLLNIAISADYGLGKSSVLNKVKENHGDSAIVISLSTLNPKEGLTKVNNAQKQNP